MFCRLPSRSAAAVLLAASLVTPAAFGAIGIWGWSSVTTDGYADARSTGDAVVASPGIELQLFGHSCTQDAPDGNGLVASTYSRKIKVYSADGSALLTNFDTYSVESGRFPPFGTPGVSYFDERGTISQMAGTCGFPAMQRYGNGGAAAGGQNYNVRGRALIGGYNAGTPTSVDVSKFGIFVYDLSGAMVWSKIFPGTDANGFKINTEFSTVANHLNGDSDEEVRIVARRATTTPGGAPATETFVRYFNLQTGALISSKKIKVPNP
jgi:hypothetical protein